MTKRAAKKRDRMELRRQAEAWMRENETGGAPPPKAMMDAARMMHELQVHQIELETQNDELRRTREALEATQKGVRDRLERVVAERTADLAEANARLFQDLVERQRGEKALRESEERYRRLLASITSYVYRVDLVAGVPTRTEHGEGCQGVTGYTPAEYAANDFLWFAMIPDEDRPAVLDAMTRILTSRSPITIEHRILHKDGRLRWIHNTLVPHHDIADTLTFYDGVISDITERKNHEEERIRLEREARREENLRALGRLVAGVAHEVRNPMNAIMITAELLSRHLREKPECRTYLDRIKRQIERLDNRMKDLLEFRRPAEARNLQRHTSSSLCRMAVDVWTQSRKEAKCRLIVDLPSEAENVEILVDPERMVQVLVNLLDNAAQHSNAETEIRISALPARDGVAVIRVQDQGRGFSEEGLRHAFDPFYTTRKGGSGLGLSLVKHIVEIYLGQVTIRNNCPSPGCTAEIGLPVAAQTLDA